MKPWIRNGKKQTDSLGNPILCESCPCTGGCSREVEADVASLVAQGWTVVSRMSAGYTCPTATYDESRGRWSRATYGSGRMVVVARIPSGMPNQKDYTMASYSVTLANGSSYRTICCRISAGVSSRSGAYCTHTKTSSDGWANMGICDVAENTDTSPVRCCVEDMLWSFNRNWLSSITATYGEGYWEYEDSTYHDYAFEEAFTCTSNGISYLSYKVCGSACGYSYSNNVTDTASRTHRIYSLAGACSSDCVMKIAVFRNRAIAHGWQYWEDGGFVLEKHAGYSGMYPLSPRNVFIFAYAEPNESGYSIGMVCHPADDHDACVTTWTQVDGIDQILPWAGAHECYDWKEVLFMDQSLFGISQCWFGSNWVWDDPDDGSIVKGVFLGDRMLYAFLDYNAFWYVYEKDGKKVIRVIYNRGNASDSDAYWEYDAMPTNFRQVEPFGHVEDGDGLKYWYAGSYDDYRGTQRPFRWTNEDHTYGIGEWFGTYDEAVEWASSQPLHDVASAYWENDGYEPYDHVVDRCSALDLSKTTVAWHVEKSGDRWHALPAYTRYPDLICRVQHIQTSRGILLNDGSGDHVMAFHVTGWNGLHIGESRSSWVFGAEDEDVTCDHYQPQTFKCDESSESEEVE